MNTIAEVFTINVYAESKDHVPVGSSMHRSRNTRGQAGLTFLSVTVQSGWCSLSAYDGDGVVRIT